MRDAARPLLVIDTNILISAEGGFVNFARKNALFSTACKIIIAAITEKVEFVLSPATRDEYLKKCAPNQTYKNYHGRMPPPWLSGFMMKATILDFDPAPTPGMQVKDSDDLPFLALARYTGATLVTSNIADFPGEGRDGVEVLLAGHLLGKFPQLKACFECCKNGCCPGKRLCRNHGGGR